MDDSNYYPYIEINITNKCNLRCTHCYFYKPGNVNLQEDEIDDDDLMFEKIENRAKKHKSIAALWVGGEPLLRYPLLKKVVTLFHENHIATNGTIPLKDLGPSVLYMISIDGLKETHDNIRGKGCFDKIMKNIENIPDGFQSRVQAIVTITKQTVDQIEPITKYLKEHSPIKNINYHLYSPLHNEVSDLRWNSLEERDEVIYKLIEMKEKYPNFVSGLRKAFDFMLSKNRGKSTDNCFTKTHAIPLFLKDKELARVSQCCMGADIYDCDYCGIFLIHQFAAMMDIHETPIHPSLAS